MSRFGLLNACRLALCLAVVTNLNLILTGCGGGGSGSTPPPAQTPGDFTLSVTSPTQGLGPGTSLTVTISSAQVYPYNPVTGNLSISISGLPAEVTASPATISIAVGSSQTVTLTASNSVQPGTATLTFLATDGSLSHSAQTSISILAPVTAEHPPIRTRYIRTGSYFNPSALYAMPIQFTAYDAVHKQFFVSDPYANQINVFDAATQVQTGQIMVPQAWGIDISPYNGSLYAGTLIGDVYQIDTSTLSVTNRYPSSSIGSSGFIAFSVLVLSDGRLALQGSGVGYARSGTYHGNAVVWDPLTNSMDVGPDPGGGGICQFGGAFAVSGDRTRLLLAGDGQVCSYDPIAKIETFGSTQDPGSVRQIIATPDGSRFLVTTNTNGIVAYDAKTAQLLGQNIGGGDSYAQLPSGASSAVMSLDGKTLFLVNQITGDIGTFDTTTLQQTGWLPNVGAVADTIGVTIGAIDETGLIVGPATHGVQFLDGANILTSQPTYLAGGDPLTPMGPLSGGTAIGGVFGGDASNASATLTQFYVGNVPGFDAQWCNGQCATSPEVTTPPSSLAGPVDLTLVLSDGATSTIPEAFSYGPYIIEVTPNAATAEGGQHGAVFGYGFGNSTSGIQVSVGGQSATVTAITQGPSQAYSGFPYPFPVEGVHFTIPPGAEGSVADVTVTTQYGSATAKQAFRYAAPVKSYPLTANLQAGIYDSGRGLYYFADTSQIQVFSAGSTQWQAPIALPGTSSNSQLMAISESPDGTKLAVSDFGGQAIYLLNPSNPVPVAKFPMSLDTDGFAPKYQPSGLAVTNDGMVYFAAECLGCIQAPLFHKLDTVQGTITDVGTVISYADTSDQFDRVLLSPDGSRVYLGYWWFDTSTDQGYTMWAAYLSDNFTELAISADGSTLELDTQPTDQYLNVENVPAYYDWELWYATAISGLKLNQDGSILFQPLTDGIDMIARNTGGLLYRVQIPVTPASAYDPLLVAAGTNQLAVITASGVSFVDLSGLPIASEYSNPFPAAARSRAVGFSKGPVTSTRAVTNSLPATGAPTRLRLRPQRAARP